MTDGLDAGSSVKIDQIRGRYATLRSTDTVSTGPFYSQELLVAARPDAG